MNFQETLFPIPKIDLSENESKSQHGQRKLLVPSRSQVEMSLCSLNDLIAEDHPVRAVWAYVEKLDLSKALNKIESFNDCKGRPAVDPRVLVALWLFATIEGIGSARVLAAYTKDHICFKWICGNIPIERKTISDFRTNNNELFEDLLAQGVAILVHSNQVCLKEIAQDGLRVRANASKHSFHRIKTIKQQYIEAKQRVESLKKELEDDPNQCNSRQKANRKRIAEERLKKIEEAKENLEQSIREINQNRIKHKKKVLTTKERAEIRSSDTDPEARKMKMPDGSFHPAYNFQYAVATNCNVIVGLDVLQAGTDGGQMMPMFNQIKARYGVIPERYLVDGGFKNKLDVEYIAKEGCEIYMPVQKAVKGKPAKEPFTPKENESKEVGEWRQRMGKPESNEIYKKRASTVELLNANLRRFGLYRMCVRGLTKAKGIANMFAVSYNMLRSIAFSRN